MSYLEDYSKRMVSVKNQLTILGEELTKMGCDVFISNSKTIHYLMVHKQGTHISVGFSEVPYHWYLRYFFKPSKKTGSSRTIKKLPYHNYDETNLFSAQEVYDNMKEDWREVDIDTEYTIMKKIVIKE